MPRQPTNKKTGTPGLVPPRRQVLIAPWRLNYILGPKDTGCFLCEAANLPQGDEKAWKKTLLLHKNRYGLVMLNRYPYTGGHVLIAPLRHTADLAGLPAGESKYMWEFARHAVAIIGKTMGPQGFNLGLNLGKAAGAGVENHLHMHALPRWNGDTNFMHIIADTTTVPIRLDELWDRMRPLFKKL
jgi:ATP adenylyltransferase